MKHTILTYNQLDRYVKGFQEGNVGCLLITSSPGTGKTQRIRAATPNAAYISGHMTPVGLYMKAYEAHDLPIVLDDIDGLYKDDASISLLKALCQTDPSKRLVWAAASKVLRDAEIPNEFTTSSPTCIIANQWNVNNPNVAAIVDRALWIDFRPSPQEVHREAASWFHDAEIYDYIGSMLPSVTELSLRCYGRAKEIRALGDDWRAALVQSWGVDEQLALVASLVRDARYSSEGKRIEAFVALGGSRATYFRIKKELRDLGTLRHDPAPWLLAQGRDEEIGSNKQDLCRVGAG